MKKCILSTLTALTLALTLVSPAAMAAESGQSPDSIGFEHVQKDAPPDNAGLLAGYVEQVLYGDISGGFAPYGVNNPGKNMLPSELDKEIYDKLKTWIGQVAAGTAATSVDEHGTYVTFSMLTKNLENKPAKTSWTAEDIRALDNTITDPFETQSEQAVNLIYSSISHAAAIVRALIADCPYELYWFDKTVGYTYNFPVYPVTPVSAGGDEIKTYEFLESAVFDDGSGDRPTKDTTIDFMFYVSKDYETFTEAASRAQAAAANAQNVVDQITSGTSDYERLLAYKDYICNAVTYHDGAAAGNIPYGDPWQLISVFDGSGGADVVCEGYSKAFQYLCDLTNAKGGFNGPVECYTVTGNMAGGTGAGGHMWNIVTLDSKNYLVDVTNCDEGSVGEPDLLFLVGSGGGDAGSIKIDEITYNADYSFPLDATGTNRIHYKYDDDQAALWGGGVLELAAANYPRPLKGTVTIDGAAVYGQTLTAKPSVEDPDMTDGKGIGTLKYQWYRDGAAISAGAVYTAARDDVGKTLTVAVYTDDYGAATSAPVTIGKATPVLAVAPASLSLKAGTTGSFTVTFENVVPGDTLAPVSVTSSDTTKATVEGSAGTYTVTGAAAGKSTITVAYSGDPYYNEAVSAGVAVTVTEKDKLDVTIAPVSVPVGGAEPIAPVVTDKDGNTLSPGTDYTVAYKIPDGSNVAEITDSTVTGKNFGTVTAAATVTPAGSYAADYDSSTQDFTVTVTSKTVEPAVTVSGTYTYNGSAHTPDPEVKAGEVTLKKDVDYTVTYSDNINAGTNTAKVSVAAIPGRNYTWSSAGTVFSIAPADLTGSNAYLPIEPGDTSEKTIGGSAFGITEAGTFALTDGGKITGTGLDAEYPQYGADIKIKLASGLTADNRGGITIPVTFTAASTNYKPKDLTLTIAFISTPVAPGGGAVTNPVIPAAPNHPGSGSTPSVPDTSGVTPEATVSGGTAAAWVTDDQAARLVAQAASGSSTVVIAPEVSGDVSRTEVSIPASAVSGIASGSSAALKVETPAANITISNSGLSDLGGQDVVVAAERVGGAVSVEITAGGQPVSTVTGGVKAEIPAECGPGTVAQMVDENGNVLSTVRKSFASNSGDTMNVPLDGSAKVVFVDNSKSFADVPVGSWAANAVAFASGHELMNGVSAASFSPAEPMTRGMLAVVLHNLEGNPDTSYSGSFGDVSGSAWYAQAVQWAADNKIVTGGGDGSFAPNDAITREQLVVMLYRYAGQPAASGSLSGFGDAGSVSSWARQAMAWAVSSGIVGGSNGALNPQSGATRAEVAQMLMNFVSSGEI